MSLTRITVSFGGKNRNFELRIGEIAELERLCQAGVGEITARVMFDRHKLSDVRETIRLALEGAGATPFEATALVERYVDHQPLMASVALAQTILSALHHGAEILNAALADANKGSTSGGASSGEPAAGEDLAARPETAAPATLDSTTNSG